MSKHKQYFYLIVFIYVTTNIYFTQAKDLPYVDDNKLKIVNKTEIKSANNSIIPSEGGGKIILSSSSSSTPTTIEKIIIKNATSTTTTTTTTTERIKPVSEAEEIVGDSKVKPRKGVTFSEITNTTTSTTTTTTTTTKKPTTASTTVKVFIPHKPTVTISNDDDLMAKKPPPKLYINGKEVLPKPKNNTSDPPPPIVAEQHDEIYISRRTDKGPDYVLPIVLTILSVPLLAIIFTVLYKRGAEWWHHRHYRRMDFLIDGMYNN